MESFTDPASLRDSEDVPFREETRTFDEETYEALHARYQTIDGVIMYGVTDADGRVLLLGPDEWVPPGGNVHPDEDWAAATRRTAEELTGHPVAIDRPVHVERTAFLPEEAPDTGFATHVVHFRASLEDEDADFLDDPGVPDDLDHALYGDGSDLELAWFDDVPAAVAENHEEHVRLYFD